MHERSTKIPVLTLHPHHPMSCFQDQECANHSKDPVLHLRRQTQLELFQQESLTGLHEKPAVDGYLHKKYAFPLHN